MTLLQQFQKYNLKVYTCTVKNKVYTYIFDLYLPKTCSAISFFSTSSDTVRSLDALLYISDQSRLLGNIKV